jgi:8-oxo-dGTP pyrophosphatase MutT (NUDIX family)
VNSYIWIDSGVPKGLEIRQVYGFVFSSDGRILLLEDEGMFNLPGGRPENGETMGETLLREVLEEVQVTISSSEYLGYQLVTTNEEFAQARLVALADQIQPAASDLSTGRKYPRLWVPPTHSNDLLKWGESGDQQIASATAVASRLGVTWDGSPRKYF